MVTKNYRGISTASLHSPVPKQSVRTAFMGLIVTLCILQLCISSCSSTVPAYGDDRIERIKEVSKEGPNRVFELVATDMSRQIALGLLCSLDSCRWTDKSGRHHSIDIQRIGYLRFFHERTRESAAIGFGVASAAIVGIGTATMESLMDDTPRRYDLVGMATALSMVTGTLLGYATNSPEMQEARSTTFLFSPDPKFKLHSEITEQMVEDLPSPFPR